MTPIPHPSDLQKLLRYEPETGKLFWMPRPVEVFASPRHARTFATRLEGKQAFTAPHCAGYFQGNTGGHVLLAHRVIWAVVMGEWPESEIDHINGDRSDNRWSNLRAATRAQNVRNTKRSSKNTSGFKGVDWNNANQKWRARISVDGRDISLGYFNCRTAAAVARAVATPRHHAEFARV